MSTYNLKLILIALNILVLTSCSSIKDDEEDDEMRCFEELPVTEAFIEILNNPFYAEQIAVEAEFHKMVFSMSSSGTICSIGYRSGPIETGAIEIQITNESGIIVYSEKYNFSRSKTEFIEIPSVQIEADKNYQIVRRIEQFTSYSELVGPVIRNNSSSSDINPFNFPLTVDELTIHSTNFYSSIPGENFVNQFIPKLEFGFTKL